jgi:pimeloyl-ACP methyl ester carboxylesterase
MQALPRDRLVSVEWAGHLPPWGQPDAVHPVLIAFLRH